MLALVVGQHFGEQSCDRLARRRVAVGEVLERRDVLAAGEELARARLAVAAGAPDLLRVRLEALRQVEVVDVAHVGLVDAHAEGDRGDDDAAVRAGPPLLHLDAVVGVHAGVVGARGQARRSQERSNALGRPLQRDVDDRRPGRALSQPVDQQLVALRRARRCREQRQVRAVEAGHDRVALLDAEAGTDVGDDRGRGRRGQREHAFGAELARPRGELQVVGAEVVAPLRDAVRLVDGEQRDLRLAELGEEALVVEALGRDVEELQAAVSQPLRDGANVGCVEARVEPRGVDALQREQVDLVLHQRDQRGDDDGDAVEEQRGQLVAEALPRAGREDRERGASCEERVDHVLLAGPERREAEPLGEHFVRGHAGG